MFVPARWFASLLLIFFCLAVAHASVVISPPSLESPSIACNSANNASLGATLSWAGGDSSTPTIGYSDTPNDLSSFTFAPLACNNGTVGQPLDDKTKTSQSDIVIVKVVDKSSTKLIADDSSIAPTLDVNTLYVDDGAGGDLSYFDVTINYGGASPSEFIGIEFDSASFVTDGQMVVLSDGSIALDPANPGGTISLYGTPAVPEPATLPLLGTGAIAIGMALRNRYTRIRRL
jgi:hypothetical protein